MKTRQPIPNPSSGATAATDDPSASVPVEKWTIDRLKVNPLQAQFFDDLPDQQLQLLADSLKANGQEQAVEILPDGTIQRGHQRLRAAKLLGWKELDVKVRHDLQAVGPDALKQHFLGDNVHRRQLRPMNNIRCIAALWEIAQKQPRSQQSTVYKKPLRDVIGAELNMSGRNLDRYLSVLKAPVEVQEAFDLEELTLNDAARVAHVAKTIQDQILQALREGGSPKTVVRSLLPKKKPKRPNLSDAVNRFILGLQGCIAIVQPRANDVRRFTDDQVAVLEEAHTLIAQLLQQAQAGPDDDDDDEEEEEVVSFFDDPADDDKEVITNPKASIGAVSMSDIELFPDDGDTDLTWASPTALKCAEYLCARQEGFRCGTSC